MGRRRPALGHAEHGKAGAAVTTAKPKKYTRSSGFTLLELLVSLMILGLIASVGLGGVRLGARTWETVGVRSKDAGRIQMVRAFLYRELAQVTPVSVAQEDGTRSLAFKGAGDSLSFVAPLPPHFGLGGLQWMHLELADANATTSRSLVLKRRPYSAGIETPDAADEEELHVLLDDVETLAFAFFGSLEDESPAWHDWWEPRERLPELIRVRVKFAGDPARIWVDLVASRRITADLGCLAPAAISPCRGR